VHIQWLRGSAAAQITLFWAAQDDTAPERVRPNQAGICAAHGDGL
jgi:hypothetical protein